MPIDWQQLIDKKRRLAKAVPSAAELAAFERAALSVAEIPPELHGQTWGTSLGYGARTRTLVTPHPGIPHRFSQRCERIVIKLFKGPALDYQRFHQDYFPRLPVLPENPAFQQSLEAGTSPTHGTYAILEFVQGDTLRTHLETGDRWSDGRICTVVESLLVSIWIPCWRAGLRFKDCHKGNFVFLPANDRLAMIDVEQIRKSAFELIDQPDNWTDRDRHQRQALRQLPGLLSDLVVMRRTGQPMASVRRAVDEILRETRLPSLLAALARNTAPDQSAIEATRAVEAVINGFRAKGLI